MKTRKLLIVLASVGLGLGLAGCGGNADASAPTYKVPTISQMDKEKQVLMAEHKEKAAKDYVAKVKAEKEAKAESEKEAQASASTQAGGQAPSGGGYQAGGGYQPSSGYQAGGGYSGGGGYTGGGSSGGGSEWKVGESQDYMGNRWTRVSENEIQVSGCGDDQGNTWPC